jgi:hypothetical protein
MTGEVFASINGMKQKEIFKKKNTEKKKKKTETL